MTSTIVMIVLIGVLGGGTWVSGPDASLGLGRWLPVAVSEGVAGPAERQGAGPVAAKEDLGPVYMYGELLEKPYVFTNVGGDTLYLNGVPYWPMRQPPSLWDLMPESEKERLLAKSRLKQAFADSVGKMVRAMHESGATYEECLDAFAAMYDSSPFVVHGSVEKMGNGIYLRWADGNDGTIGLSFEPGAPPRTVEEIHKDLMEEFWRDVRAGTMIARGYGGYSITAPKPDMKKMNLLIERLAAGDTLSTQDMMGTPLMFKAFRKDVSRHIVRRKAKEE